MKGRSNGSGLVQLIVVVLVLGAAILIYRGFTTVDLVTKECAEEEQLAINAPTPAERKNHETAAAECNARLVKIGKAANQVGK